MFVSTKSGKTLLDKAVVERVKTKKDDLFVVVTLRGGYELSFTRGEWKVITK